MKYTNTKGKQRGKVLYKHRSKDLSDKTKAEARNQSCRLRRQIDDTECQQWLSKSRYLDPSNAEATFVQSMGMQCFLKTI